jgi:hypothetical protein
MASSREIIEASPDLKRLFEDGFEVSIKHVHLLISSVPYLKPDRTIARGTLIFPLNLQSDVTAQKPGDHTAFFAGEYPHYADGTPIRGMVANQGTKKLADGIVSAFQFSSKPDNVDLDFEVKVRRYVRLLSEPAQAIDSSVDARTRRIVEDQDTESSLVFLDTNSARAQILPISDKLKGLRIAIVGVGGTGSYVLDLVAKTPVKEIHLFDDDEFSLHNSYRAPGAPTTDQLRARMLKVHYLEQTYRRVHKGVLVHPERITAANVSKLTGMSYVFLCMDPGPDKAALVTFLLEMKIAFADTGLGVDIGKEQLVGSLTTITVTPAYNSHVGKIPVKAPGDDDLYASNIQIAELNAMNAIFAVIRWKKHFGFYHDARHEHECTYDVGANMLLNDETSA